MKEYGSIGGGRRGSDVEAARRGSRTSHIGTDHARTIPQLSPIDLRRSRACSYPLFYGLCHE